MLTGETNAASYFIGTRPTSSMLPWPMSICPRPDSTPDGRVNVRGTNRRPPTRKRSNHSDCEWVTPALAKGSGGEMGGGYEWHAAPAYRADVRRGISAITLDQHGKITHLTTVWDGR